MDFRFWAERTDRVVVLLLESVCFFLNVFPECKGEYRMWSSKLCSSSLQIYGFHARLENLETPEESGRFKSHGKRGKARGFYWFFSGIFGNISTKMAKERSLDTYIRLNYLYKINHWRNFNDFVWTKKFQHLNPYVMRCSQILYMNPTCKYHR